jgi:D-alanyl-D-alanine carboxypeptidase
MNPGFDLEVGSAKHGKQAKTNPRGYVAPSTIIDWVRADGLGFVPGSRYEYSNTDNIVIALIAEAVTGQSYGKLLSDIVFGPAKLRQTMFPTAIALPKPFIRGYVVAPGAKPQDVSTFSSPSGAWASGAIVSTPMGRSERRRRALGDNLAQHPRAEGRAAQAAAVSAGIGRLRIAGQVGARPKQGAGKLTPERSTTLSLQPGQYAWNAPPRPSHRAVFTDLARAVTTAVVEERAPRSAATRRPHRTTCERLGKFRTGVLGRPLARSKAAVHPRYPKRGHRVGARALGASVLQS